MNRRNLFLTAGLAFMVTFLVALPAFAKAEKMAFWGTTKLAGPPIDPGKCTHPDRREVCLGFSVPFYNDVNDVRFKGEIVVVINSNFRIVPAPVYNTGSQSGTFQMQNDQCTWQGTWMGYREENGFTYLSGVGLGQCGNDRLQVHWMGKRLDPDNTRPIDLTGYITSQ